MIRTGAREGGLDNPTWCYTTHLLYYGIHLLYRSPDMGKATPQKTVQKEESSAGRRIKKASRKGQWVGQAEVQKLIQYRRAGPVSLSHTDSITASSAPLLQLIRTVNLCSVVYPECPILPVRAPLGWRERYIALYRIRYRQPFPLASRISLRSCLSCR